MPRMSFCYLQSKGVGRISGKLGVRQIISESDWSKVLGAALSSADDGNACAKRDHATLYLGYMLGLRISEACLLERRHFKDLEKNDSLTIPTHAKGGSIDREPLVVESQVSHFILDYLETGMRSDQRYLFESSPGTHISASYLSRVFSTHAANAGISKKLSWQSMRNARGMRLWAISRNAKMVMDGLRLTDTRSVLRFMSLDEEMLADYTKQLGKVAFGPPRKRRTIQPRKVGAKHG